MKTRPPLSSLWTWSSPTLRFGFLLALAVTVPVRAQELTLKPVIRVVGYEDLNPTVTGMAPLTVNLDGVESVVGTGTHLTARFEWFFGDPDAEFNVLNGWGGAHVYDVAGTYTITLTITNDHYETDSTSIQVEVMPDSRRRVYISADGNDLADGLTPETAVRTIKRAESLLADDTSLLFRRGDEFDLSTERLVVEQLHNVVIGAYGNGDRPLLIGPETDPDVVLNPELQLNLLTIGTVNGTSPTGPVTISDLDFRTSLPASSNRYFHNAVKVQGQGTRNVTLRHSFCHDVGGCLITGSGGRAVHEGVADHPEGLLLLRNAYGSLTDYFTFFTSNNTTVLGTETAGHGSRVRRIFHFYADRVFVLHNTFQQGEAGNEEFAAAGGPHCITGTDEALADCQEASENRSWGAYAYIADNVLDGTLRLGYDFDEAPESYYQWIVIERNRFTRKGLNRAQVPILHHRPYTRHVMVRNNVFEAAAGSSTFSGTGAQDISFYHNTGIDPYNEHTFIIFEDTAPAPGTFAFTNNLWVSPNYDPGIYEGQAPYSYTLRIPWSDLSGFHFSGNFWPTSTTEDGSMYVEAPVSPEAWLGYDQTNGDVFHLMPLEDLDPFLAPLPGTPPSKTVQPVPGVFVDFWGAPRPRSGSWTAGAMELVPSLPTEPDPVPAGRHLRSYPNPFVGAVTFAVTLPTLSTATLDLYDVQGRHVATLLSGHLPAGPHEVRWDGSGLPAGVYFAVLRHARGIDRLPLVRIR